MRRVPMMVLWIAMLTACATGVATRPADVANAEVNVQLRNRLFFGSGQEASAQFDVAVRNRAAVPIRVRKIRLLTPGMLQYTLRPVELPTGDTLAPGEAKTYFLATTAYSQVGPDPAEPMNIRVEIDFEAKESRYRDVFNILMPLP